MPDQQNDMQQSQKQKASPTLTEGTETKKENQKVNMADKENTKDDPSSCGPSGCGSC